MHQEGAPEANHNINHLMPTTAATTPGLPSSSEGDERKSIDKKTAAHLRALSSLRDTPCDPEDEPAAGYSSQSSSESTSERLARQSKVRELQAKICLVGPVKHASPNPPSSPSSNSDLQKDTETSCNVCSDVEYTMDYMLAQINGMHLCPELQAFRGAHRAQTSGGQTARLDLGPNSESSSNRSSLYEPSPTQVTFAPELPPADEDDGLPNAGEESKYDLKR